MLEINGGTLTQSQGTLRQCMNVPPPPPPPQLTDLAFDVIGNTLGRSIFQVNHFTSAIK